MMAHVDLCSGIGGFALGFEWAELSKPVLFCDIEPWSRQILAKHWPDVPIADDVKELANDPTRIIHAIGDRRSILSCGYPCQPFSQAGQRRGSEDDRHIWPEIFSIVQQVRPDWLICENVSGHITMGLNEVLSDLADKANYAVQTFHLGAVSVDARHRRMRIWIVARNVADTQSLFSNVGREHTEQSKRQVSKLGERGGKINVADTDSKRLQGQWREHEFVSEREAEHSVGSSGEEVRAREYWKPEPPVGRVAHGIPRRVDRLKGLGNAIVPQIAMRIGQTIKAVEETT